MITTLNAWGAAWAAWFGPLLAQDTVFLLLVFLALRLLRDAPARVRAAVATAGVVKLALPAFVPVARPAAEAAAPAAGTVATLLFPFAERAGTAAAGPEWTGGLGPAAALLVAWAGLALARVGWVGLQTLQLALAVRGATDVDAADLPPDVRRAGLAVRRCARIPMPLSFGPWPRTIYVPAAWDGWDRPARDAVLRHELAHVQRRDGLVLCVEILVQAVWFFHPLVALLIRRLRTWREMACDDRCLAADPGARLAYTRFLAGLAESALLRPVVTESASTLLRGRSELLSRVTHQLKESAMKPVPKTRVVLVAALLAAAVVPLSMVLADTPAPPAPPAAAEPAQPDAVAPPAPVASVAPAEAPAPPPQDKEQQKKDQEKKEQYKKAQQAAEGDAAPAKEIKASKEQEIKAKQAAHGDLPPPPPPAIKVAIHADGVAVNGETVSDAALGEVLRKHAQAKGKGVVVALDADGGVPMGELHRVQAALRDADLHKVVYGDDLRRALPLMLPPGKLKAMQAKLEKQDLARVQVDPAGVVTLDGDAVGGAALAEQVRKRLTKRPGTVFVLETAAGTRYGAFVQVLEGLQEGGAKRIAVDDPKL